MQNKKEIKKYFIDVVMSKFINSYYIKKNEYDTRNKFYIDTLQELEEVTFNNWYNYDIADNIEVEEEEINQVKNYLQAELKEELKVININSYTHKIISEIKQAKSRAYDNSSMNYYIIEDQKLIFKAIEKTSDELNAIKYKFIDHKTGEEIDKYEATAVRFYFDKNKTQELVKTYTDEKIKDNEIQEELNYINDQEGLDWYIKEVTDNDRENIDSYGLYDDWLYFFKNFEELSNEIKKEYKEEQAKKDNKEFLKNEIEKRTLEIKKMLVTYSTDQEYNNNIKRQIGSLEAIAKKATKIKSILKR